VYFGLATASLRLAYLSSNATAVWPPSGFAFAAILILGRRIIPGILLGAFAANLLEFMTNNAANATTAVWTSALIGAGNTGEAIMGYFLLKKLIPGITSQQVFQKVHHIFSFVYATVIMCLVSCLVGSLTVYFADIIRGDQFIMVMFTWWTGDVSGILLITPLLLVWSYGQVVNPMKAYWKSIMEGVFLVFCLIFITGLVFEAWFKPPFPISRAFWITPFLIWAAVRFKQQVVITTVMITAVIAIWATVNGQGPFSSTSLNESLLTVQGFVSINSIMTLVLNAALLERKKTEASLRMARNNLERLVEERTTELTMSNFQLAVAQRLSHIGSWEWDIQNNRITWSDELYRIYMQSKQSFDPTYENYLNSIHPEDRNKVNETVQRCYKSHLPFDFYHRIVRPDGEVRVLHARGEVIKDENGAVVKMAGTGQDVTETKLAEDLLLRTTQELAQKNKELERSNKELASFSYAASHDLQEPLRKIQLFADRILQKEHGHLSEAAKGYFARIQAAAERMKMLIHNLLSYSSVNNSVQHFEETDLNQLIKEVLNDLHESIVQRNAVIETYSLPRIKVIPFQIKQLFTNIISNSLKFSKKDSRPHIIIKAEEVNYDDTKDAVAGISRVVYHLTISDNGIGFDPAYSEKIFEIFQRLHGQSEYTGTGIGLAICKKIIENHQGMITAQGEAGKGASFHIYLPVEAITTMQKV
jgi:PAS domain S-box-containing protein